MDDKFQLFKNLALLSGYSPEEISAFETAKTQTPSAQLQSNYPKTPVVALQNQETGEINPFIKKYFPQEQWQNAQRVMMGESGGRADAIGDNYPIGGEIRPSYGLFQIRTFPDRPSPDQLLDPEVNVKYAAEMQAKQGWGPWSAARKLGIK